MRKKQEKPKATIYPKKLTITNEKKEKKGSNKDNKISEIMKLLNLETSEKVNDSKKGKNTNFDKIDNNQKGDNFIKKQNIENRDSEASNNTEKIVSSMDSIKDFENLFSEMELNNNERKKEEINQDNLKEHPQEKLENKGNNNYFQYFVF